MQLPLLLRDLKWPEIENIVDNTTQTVIVPMGPSEEHGPHMTTAIDYLRPEIVALEAARETPVLVHPTLTLGTLTSSRTFPGSVSVEPDTLKAVMSDMFFSFTLWGIKHVIFLSGHGGSRQVPMAKALVKELSESNPNCNAYYIGVSELGGEELESLLTPGKANHAAEQETSEMLYAYPEVVEFEKAAEDYPDKEEIKKDFTRAREFWKLGIDGDARLASREKGEKLVKLEIAGLTKFLKELTN